MEKKVWNSPVVEVIDIAQTQYGGSVRYAMDDLWDNGNHREMTFKDEGTEIKAPHKSVFKSWLDENGALHDELS